MHAWVGPAPHEKARQASAQTLTLPRKHTSPGSPAARPGQLRYIKNMKLNGIASTLRKDASTPAPGEEERFSPCPAQPTCSSTEQTRELAGCPAHVPFLEPLPAPPQGSLPGPCLPPRRGSGEQRQPPPHRHFLQPSSLLREEPRIWGGFEPVTASPELEGSEA